MIYIHKFVFIDIIINRLRHCSPPNNYNICFGPVRLMTVTRRNRAHTRRRPSKAHPTNFRHIDLETRVTLGHRRGETVTYTPSNVPGKREQAHIIWIWIYKKHVQVKVQRQSEMKKFRRKLNGSASRRANGKSYRRRSVTPNGGGAGSSQSDGDDHAASCFSEECLTDYKLGKY